MEKEGRSDTRIGPFLPTVKTEPSAFLDDFYLVSLTLITFCIVIARHMKNTRFTFCAVKPLYPIVMINNV
jgi:hypothetical protein